MTTKVHIYDVQASEPREVTRPDGTVARSTPIYSNVQVHVLAPTMERAIELVRARHPEAVLHQVNKRNRADGLLIDPEFAQEPQ